MRYLVKYYVFNRHAKEGEPYETLITEEADDKSTAMAVASATSTFSRNLWSAASVWEETEHSKPKTFVAEFRGGKLT